jgi:hypothetical protein
MDVTGGGGQLDAEFGRKDNNASVYINDGVTRNLTTLEAMPILVGKDELPFGFKAGFEGEGECMRPQVAPEAMPK